MASKKKQRMKVHEWDQFSVMDLGHVEIWDGADLALLRETQSRLVEREQCRFLGVNMEFVKYIPSGFFGMLFDLHERGVAIRLYAPQPHVKNMLWFRQFFDHLGHECYALCSEPKQILVPTDEDIDWDESITWPENHSVSAHSRD
jgi:hypothetical protein